MKKVYLILVLSLLIMPTLGHVASAQGGYHISEEAYQEREAYQDYQESKADMEELELERKVAAFEEQEEKEQAEADKANKRLLVYVVVGVSGIMLAYYLGHLWQKYSRR